MNFSDFIKKGEVKKNFVNTELIKSLIKNVKKDLFFLESVKINGDSSRKIMTNYYDSLRIVLEAIACSKGYKVYNHKAFVFFLKEIDENKISIEFDRLRKIRNSINYYGEDISLEETTSNVKEIKKIINYLLGKYLK